MTVTEEATQTPTEVWTENEIGSSRTTMEKGPNYSLETKNKAWWLLKRSTVYCNSKPVGISTQVRRPELPCDYQAEVSGDQYRPRASEARKGKRWNQILDAEVVGSFCLLIAESILYLMQKKFTNIADLVRVANFTLGLIYVAFCAIMIAIQVRKSSSSSVLVNSLRQRKKMFGLFEPLDVVEYLLVLVYVSMAMYDFVRLLRGRGPFSYPSAPLWVSVAIFLARVLGNAAQTVSPGRSDIESPRPSDSSPSDHGPDQPLILMRDFIPCALAIAMTRDQNKGQIVRNFLLETVKFMDIGKIGIFSAVECTMPSAFRVVRQSDDKKEKLVADFGATTPFEAMASLDPGLWWIILLRAYMKSSDDVSFQRLPQIQRGLKTIMKTNLSLRPINTTMGTTAHWVDTEVLFYFAMKCAMEMLQKEHGNMEMFKNIRERAMALRKFIQEDFWFDDTKLEVMTIPKEFREFVTAGGGYFTGEVHWHEKNLQWISAVNLMAIVGGLTTSAQLKAIMDLIDVNWDKLIGEMPLKKVYPAGDWKIVPQDDRQSGIRSDHNNASFPGMLWLFTAACVTAGRPEMAERAMRLTEERLAVAVDKWPEYYGGETGNAVGTPARLYQLSTIGSYLVSTMIIENHENIRMIIE